MRRVFISGIKGGVGSTVIVANLASALSQAGETVICVDLDSKNELRLHFAHQWSDPTGWSSSKNLDLTQCAFVDNDSVSFIPHGDKPSTINAKKALIEKTHQLDLPNDAWLLFDVPSYGSAESFALKEDDLHIRVVNCDANCHSLINQRLFKQTNTPEYVLVNRFNGSANIEVEIMQLWRDEVSNLLPFFIHQDEVIKEALAYKNVAFNCAPHSVIRDDFQALISWLHLQYSKASQ